VTLERYTKFGRVVRLERDLRRTAIITVDESGESLLGDGSFEARPLDERIELPELHPELVESVAARIAAMLEPPVAIERLLITQGVSRHRFACGDERHEWQEEAARIHLALANPERHLRALLDLGAPSFETLDLHEIADAIGALALPAGPPEEGSTVRLAPNVAAALWSAMATFAPYETKGGFSLRQTAGIDGRGREIAQLALLGVDAGAPTNAFRPSYRARPIVAPFHVRAAAFSRVVEAADEAIALLAPMAIHDGTIEMAVLVKSGERSRTVRIEATVGQWAGGVEAIEAAERWYPLGAGVFGSRSTIARSRMV
jgi:hypothetical protein